MEGAPRRLGARRDGGRRGAASARGGDGWGAALQKMERLRTQDALHSWQTFVLLGWEESSLGTYQCHLRRLAAVERRFPCDAKERVLEQAILECARLGKSESTIKGIISAAVMATEVRLVDACIPATIWRSVKAAKKTRNAAKERIWGSPIMLLHMAARASSLEDWAVVGLAIVSFPLFLRVGEAVTLQPWVVVDDAVRFFDSKTRQDWQQRSLTTLTREWLQWLQRHFPEPAAEGRRPWTTQQPEKGIQRLLVGSPFEGARWHAWRRAGARAMWTAGATIRQVAVWGRWARDSTARWYAHPTETQPVQAEDFWPRPPREGAGGRWRSRTTSLRLEQLWPSGIRQQWKHRKEHVAFGPSRTMPGTDGHAGNSTAAQGGAGSKLRPKRQLAKHSQAPDNGGGSSTGARQVQGGGQQVPASSTESASSDCRPTEEALVPLRLVPKFKRGRAEEARAQGGFKRVRRATGSVSYSSYSSYSSTA